MFIKNNDEFKIKLIFDENSNPWFDAESILNIFNIKPEYLGTDVFNAKNRKFLSELDNYSTADTIQTDEIYLNEQGLDFLLSFKKKKKNVRIFSWLILDVFMKILNKYNNIFRMQSDEIKQLKSKIENLEKNNNNIQKIIIDEKSIKDEDFHPLSHTNLCNNCSPITTSWIKQEKTEEN